MQLVQQPLSQIPRLSSQDHVACDTRLKETITSPTYDVLLSKSPSRQSPIEDIPRGKPSASRGLHSHCTCICHRQAQWRSPSSSNMVLGILFVRYTPWQLALIAHACNCSAYQQAKTSAVTITYTFPVWLLQRTLTMKAQSRGPELLLRVRRVRPKDAAIFLALEHNDVGAVKRLLAAGNASMHDVNEDGQSLLHVRLRLNILEVLS